MIRLLTTLAGARRAARDGPILRLLDDPEDAFIVGLQGSSSVMAVDPRTGRADGVVTVLDLMAGDLVSSPPVEAGDDQRQGVTEAGHAVLDTVDQLRGRSADDIASLLREADNSAGLARSGSLPVRRVNARKAAALLILAIEEIDRELAS